LEFVKGFFKKSLKFFQVFFARFFVPVSYPRPK
jgi:hypothetical protein